MRDLRAELSVPTCGAALLARCAPLDNAATVVTRQDAVLWVVLVHRMPREPSSPRISVWRRLRRLGVAQLADGVVALPEDARTREQLEWVADQVVENGGEALLLRAQTLARSDERAIARRLAHARAEEYRAIAEEAAVLAQGGQDTRRALARLRRELRAVQRRDYFPPPDRHAAAAAVKTLAARSDERQQVGR